MNSTTAQKAEILAPAGSFECMKAAFLAGADAVYAGGAMFGARASAVNFSGDELLDAIDYAHLQYPVKRAGTGTGFVSVSAAGI